VPAPTSTATERPVARSRRDDILDTALDLMAEHGASATSMRSLATACNLNVAALYHYFPSKADLLRSVIDERRYTLRLRDAPAIDVTLPPRERLVALVLAMWDGVREEEAVWRLLLGEALRGDETAAAVGREILDALAPALRDWLDALFTEPDGTRSLDPDAVANVLVSTVFSFFIGQLFRPAETREAAARHDAEALATLALAATTTG
jgi:AcrR family transcriptional regulator